MRYFYTQMF